MWIYPDWSWNRLPPSNINSPLDEDSCFEKLLKETSQSEVDVRFLKFIPVLHLVDKWLPYENFQRHAVPDIVRLLQVGRFSSNCYLCQT